MIPKKLSERGRLITCSECGFSGGTLVKDGKGGYKHSDNDSRCRVLRLRKKLQ